jgi:ABC-type lipopolysaccharide export system ATPase subunit
MLSGSQRAQLALTLAVAKRPELLLLDDPVASLDPSHFCSHRRGRVGRLSVRSLGLTSGPEMLPTGK